MKNLGYKETIDLSQVQILRSKKKNYQKFLKSFS